jgi:uncharacterized membrane protein YbhN (UPF0104 family)
MPHAVRRLARPVAVGAVILFAALSVATNRDAFLEAAAALSPTALAAAVGLGALYWLALAVAWWRVQAALGGELRLGTAVRIWSVSTVARYVPGNVWHIASRAALAHEVGGRPVAVLTASAYEQVLTLGSAFLVAGLLLPLAGGGPAYLAAAATLPLGLAVLHPIAQRAVVHRAARLLGQPPPRVLAVRQVAALLVLYALPNVPAGLALMALGWPTGPGAVGATGAFGFAWAVGFLSFFTPSGLGVREVTLAGLLAAGLGGSDPVLLAVGHRVVLTVAELALAAGAAVGGRLAGRML